MGARDTMTGGQMLLSWVYHMLDDDESGTIDPGKCRLKRYNAWMRMAMETLTPTI